MRRELSNKIIFNDFVNNVYLTEDEEKVLEMYVKRYSLIKMADVIGMSDRNVSRILRQIKGKYKDFKKIESAKLEVFNSQKNND